MQQQVLKSKAMQRMEYRLGEPLETFFRRRYHDEGATLHALAAELGVSVGTVSRWFVSLGVEARMPGPRPKTAA